MNTNPETPSPSLPTVTEEKEDSEKKEASEHSTHVLQKALRELLALLDRGVIVRNTEQDGDFASFAKQGLEIVRVVGGAQNALDLSLADGQPEGAAGASSPNPSASAIPDIKEEECSSPSSANAQPWMECAVEDIEALVGERIDEHLPLPDASAYAAIINGHSPANSITPSFDEEPSANAQGLMEALKTVVNFAEWGWTIIANAGGGDWEKESPDWQKAAAQYRDDFFNKILPSPSLIKEQTAKEDYVPWDKATQEHYERLEAELGRARLKLSVLGEKGCQP